MKRFPIWIGLITIGMILIPMKIMAGQFDAPYYAYEKRHKTIWAKGDKEIDNKLAALGKKLGKNLLNFAKQKAIEKQLSGVSLEVIIENRRAIDFYKREGFTITRTDRSRIASWILGNTGSHYMKFTSDS